MFHFISQYTILAMEKWHHLQSKKMTDIWIPALYIVSFLFFLSRQILHRIYFSVKSYRLGYEINKYHCSLKSINPLRHCVIGCDTIRTMLTGFKVHCGSENKMLEDLLMQMISDPNLWNQTRKYVCLDS